MRKGDVDFIKNDNDICIGANIRRIRLERGIGQTQLVALLQLEGISITRQALVKIEASTQHVKATQFKAIKKVLNCSYEDLLQEREE